MMKLLKFGAVGAIAVAVLVWPLAWYLDSTAQTVHYISLLDDAAIEANRFTFEDDAVENPTDDDIIAIYGSRSGTEPETIIFPDEAKIIRPKERPGLALYAKDPEEDLWQTQRVFYLTRAVSIGAAATGFGLVLLLVFLRRRASRAGAQPATA